MNRIDHIVVAADSLERGVDYLRDGLGVDIPVGGKHVTMGTHNHLMQLGDGVYLELIAIDPGAKPPGHPRWFGLDDANMRARLERGPALITWVMRSVDLLRVKQKADFEIGEPTELARDHLRWRIALTDDGRLLGNGLLPYVIQWDSEPHPSTAMAQLGCRLLSLELFHNRPNWLRDRLSSIAADHLVDIHALVDDEAPYLCARIETPLGIKTLSSLPG